MKQFERNVEKRRAVLLEKRDELRAEPEDSPRREKLEEEVAEEERRTNIHPIRLCKQKENSILYLPAGWSHLTLNLGETVAIGGQVVYSSPSLTL